MKVEITLTDEKAEFKLIPQNKVEQAILQLAKTNPVKVTSNGNGTENLLVSVELCANSPIPSSTKVSN